MDIQQLQYFLAVSRSRSFTRAAEELFISRQAVAQSVRQLEKELKAELFLREKKHLQLTPFGEVFAGEAEKITSKFQKFEQSMKVYAAAQPVTLRIAVGAGVLMHLSTERFTRFHDENPNVLLYITEMDNREMTRQIKEGRIDLGLIGTSARYLQSFSASLIRKSTLFICVNRDNPISEKEELRIEDLKGQPMVGHGEGYDLHRFYVEKCMEAGFAPTFSVISSDPQIAITLVKENRSLCFGMPPTEYDSSEMNSTHVKVLPLKLEEAEDWGIYAITKQGEERNISTQMLVDWLG
ncbi:MAG: LysR family transcriptional regulator [Eubacteriales bacterium]|nr:LysR family transcriptional regulator [Eubacteriales bacterium]